MNLIVRKSVVGVALLLAAGLFAACGDDGNATRGREAVPFIRIKLKNVSPPEGHPATAHAEGRKRGAPVQMHDVGPVPPGDEATSEPPGTKPSDGVMITVDFEGGPSFHGEGDWPESSITEVDIECGEQGEGTATVHFGGGQPAETIPLHP